MAKTERKSGLGRDLLSLFEDNTIPNEKGGTVMLHLSDIEPNKAQPRKKFDDEDLATLAASIAELGLLQPIIVTENIDYPGMYRIIAGERRWRASRLAGLTEVPCIVFSGDELTRAQIALVENIQRKDLNPIEEAQGLRDLMERFGLTQEECSAKTGRSREAIANTVRLLSLPDEVLQMVSDGELSAGHARALISLDDKVQAVALAKKIIETGMSVRDTEKAVKILKKPVKEQIESQKDLQSVVYFKDLERRSMELCGHRVKIVDGGDKKRKLIIDYSNNEDLEELLIKICGNDIIGQ